MSKLTQKAIQNSFLKLLESKPIDHITIKDITDDCGISRNTFYSITPTSPHWWRSCSCRTRRS